MKHEITRSMSKSFWEHLNIDARVVLDWVEDNFLPEEIFSEEALARWADENDYKQAEQDYPEREL